MPPKRAKFVRQKLVPSVKSEVPLPGHIPPPSLPVYNSLPPLPVGPVSKQVKKPVRQKHYTKKVTIERWKENWGIRGFEFVELEKDPTDSEKILAQFRCKACRECGFKNSAFYDGILSTSTSSLRHTLYQHFEGQMSASARDRIPGCIGQRKYLKLGIEYASDDEETCSEEEWAPPPIREQKKIEKDDRKEEEYLYDHLLDDEARPIHNSIAKRGGHHRGARNTSKSSRKRKYVDDDDKPRKLKKQFKPQDKDFIATQSYFDLQEEFSKDQSFCFEIVARKPEPENMICGRIQCMACFEATKGSRTGHREAMNMGIVTRGGLNLRETLVSHSYPNPGVLKLMPSCLKHQSALKDWIVKKKMHETRHMPLTNYLPADDVEVLRAKYRKRGIQIIDLHKKQDMDGSLLLCCFIRCEACSWQSPLNGRKSDCAPEFDLSKGIISGPFVAKLIKRHCKRKNSFHSRAWDQWRTIQKLRIAQQREYKLMIKTKRSQALNRTSSVPLDNSVGSFSVRLSRKQVETIDVQTLSVEYPQLKIMLQDSRMLHLKGPKYVLSRAQEHLEKLLWS